MIPSSNRLACLITVDVNSETGPVLEFGPGTGVFTKALIQRGVQPQDLTLVEIGSEFADALAEQYPRATIIRADAARLSPRQFELPRLHGLAISGLPLLAMPSGKVMRILKEAFGLLDADAGFYQFTYGWRCPVPDAVLNRLALKADKIGIVLSNFPPATVYRITRRKNPANSWFRQMTEATE